MIGRREFAFLFASEGRDGRVRDFEEDIRTK